MPVRLCTEPTCPNPARYRGYCETHARARNRATHRNRQIYASKRWQLLRRKVLHEQPICAGCDNALSVDVHHKIDLDKGGAPFERSNVVGLCKPCHSKITRREQQP